MVFIIRIREILFSGRSWRAGLYVVAFCFFFLSLSALPSGAQVNREKFVLHVHKTLQPVTVDGVLDEPCWQRAEVAKDFFRILPIDTGQARTQTEVRVTYDDKNLYFGIVCYDPTPGKRPVESLRRDFKFPLNDNFLIFMDTYNDLTNGFSFGISAAGAQWDGIQANGGYVSLLSFESKGILGSISKLYGQGSIVVASIILLFSVLLPFAKTLAMLFISIFEFSPFAVSVVRFFKHLGKWSMIDVFVVAIFLVYLTSNDSDVSHAEVEIGLYFFVVYVLLSIVTSLSADKLLHDKTANL